MKIACEASGFIPLSGSARFSPALALLLVMTGASLLPHMAQAQNASPAIVPGMSPSGAARGAAPTVPGGVPPGVSASSIPPMPAGPAASPPPVATAAMTPPPSPAPLPAPSFEPMPMANAAVLPMPGMAPSGNMSVAHDKSLAPLEDKVTESARNVVKQFSMIDNVNLEDLNTARQAVAKLDVLIDIEKHLAELDKLHAERNGEKSLAAAIPASALRPNIISRGGNEPPNEAPVSPISSHSEVSRVIGADGHYAAVILDKTVRVGDTMSDGSSVVGISPKGVETRSKDGTLHHMKVKGVDQVYGGTL
jgi:hypothetical protein